MSPPRASLLLIAALVTLPAQAGRRDRKAIEEETQRSPAASASDIPALDDLLQRAGWQPTPELSGAFKAGGIFTETMLGHQIALDDCFETEPTESTYTATEIVTNLQAGVSVKVGAGEFGASGGLMKKIKFSTPVHAAIPTLRLKPSEKCRAELSEAGQTGMLDLAKTYVVKEVLTAQIAEQTCGRVDAHGAFAVLGQADAELSMACAQHSLEPVAVAYRTTPVNELRELGAGSGGGDLEVGSSGGSGDLADQLAQLELAQRQREAAEAVAAEAAAKERELLARLAAEREQKLDKAQAAKRQEAARMWASMAPIVEKGGFEAARAVELFVKEYGSAEVWVKDSTGRYVRAVDAPEIEEARAWLGAHVTVEIGGPMAGISWLPIPGGSFEMGSNDGDKDEKPVHTVRVSAFEMSRTEVTFGQYQACVDAGACTAPHVSDGTCAVKQGGIWGRGKLPKSFQGADQPVVCVEWEQAGAFARWLGVRLPTEAEWEYAARGGGQDVDYPWGNQSAGCNYAVLDDGGEGCGRDSTWPVCSKPEGNTDQGLCDMAGNVWEWVEDWYHDSYSGAPLDGSAWLSPAGSYRVFRGGSWSVTTRYVLASLRSRDTPDHSRGSLGFRLAR